MLVRSAAFLLAAVLANPTAAADSTCPETAEVEIATRLVRDDAGVGHTLSRDELAKRFDRPGDRDPVGHTETRVDLQTDVDKRYMDIGTGTCIDIGRVSVRLISRPRIEIASSIPENTCSWNQVLRFERNHVQAVEKAVGEMESWIRESLDDELSRLDGRQFFSLDAADRTLRAIVTSVLQEAQARINLRTTEIHRQRRSERDLTAVCDGKLMEFVTQESGSE